MKEERSRICQFCGLEAPREHWRPYSYIEYHEQHCEKNPSNHKEEKQ